MCWRVDAPITREYWGSCFKTQFGDFVKKYPWVTGGELQVASLEDSKTISTDTFDSDEALGMWEYYENDEKYESDVPDDLIDLGTTALIGVMSALGWITAAPAVVAAMTHTGLSTLEHGSTGPYDERANWDLENIESGKAGTGEFDGFARIDIITDPGTTTDVVSGSVIDSVIGQATTHKTFSIYSPDEEPGTCSASTQSVTTSPTRSSGPDISELNEKGIIKVDIDELSLEQRETLLSERMQELLESQGHIYITTDTTLGQKILQLRRQ